MRSTKLFQLLSTLSHKELLEFKSHLLLISQRGDSKAVALLKALIPIVMDEKLKPVTEDEVWRTAFPKQKLGASQLRNIKTFMVSALREFISHRYLREEEGQETLFFLQHLEERQAAHAFQQEWEKGERKCAASSPLEKDADHLLLEFRLGMLQVKAKAKSGVRTPDSFLMETMQRLDSFYALQKLRLACAYLNQGGILDASSSAPAPNLASYARSVAKTAPSQHSLFAKVYLMLHDPDDPKHFNQLIARLFDPQNVFSKEVFAECFVYVINRCIRRINQGQAGAKREYLDLFARSKSRKEARALLLSSPLQRKNLVQVAASLYEFTYADEIAAYEQDKHPETVITKAFHEGVICFYKGNLKEAIQKFKEVDDDSKDRFYRLDARVFMLLALYGKNDEMRDALYDAFRMKLGRDQTLSPAHKKKFVAFQRFFARLMRIQPDDPHRLALLKAKIAKSTSAKQYVWVFDWLAQLPRA